MLGEERNSILEFYMGAIINLYLNFKAYSIKRPVGTG